MIGPCDPDGMIEVVEQNVQRGTRRRVGREVLAVGTAPSRGICSETPANPDEALTKSLKAKKMKGPQDDSDDDDEDDNDDTANEESFSKRTKARLEAIVDELDAG